MTTASEKNREFYDQSFPGRDDYWKKMAAPRARVRALMRLIRERAPRSVVDLGSGGGQLLEEIGETLPGVALAGVDIAAAQLAENAKRLPGVAWHRMDLDAGEPVPEALAGAFDVVIASELIEHLDHADVFLEKARALAKLNGGTLLLTTQSGPLRETERRVGHRRHWDPREMESLLAKTGWIVERVWNEGFPFHDLSKWYANRDPDGAMDRFAAKPYGLYEDTVCLALRTVFRWNSRSRGAQLFAVARRGNE
jgi:SAM-dependent methyltransferase